MSAANKRKGATYELDLLKGLRNEGIDAERLRLVGVNDENDLALKVGGLVHLIEAKNRAQINLSEFVQEAERGAHNYRNARNLGYLPHYAVYIKKRNAGLFEGYAVMPIHEHLRLIQSFGPPF